MTPFHLITGFLGSGKTTLLSHLLKELTPHHRVAVIQNEFSPSGVDGRILQRTDQDFRLVEINNGSVFCVCQLGGFEKRLVKLLDDFTPDLVFLEASGLADPISLVDTLAAPGLEGRVQLGQAICLVDAPNFMRGLDTLQRTRHQLMVADTVIINKLDLFDGDPGALERRIRSLNPWAEIHTAVQARISWADVLHQAPAGNPAASSHSGQVSAGRPEMGACVLRTHEQPDRNGLEQFLRHLQADCPRIKGFLTLKGGLSVSVNCVYEQAEIKEIADYTGPSELIAFGEGLTAGVLRQTFSQYC